MKDLKEVNIKTLKENGTVLLVSTTEEKMNQLDSFLEENEIDAYVASESLNPDTALVDSAVSIANIVTTADLYSTGSELTSIEFPEDVTNEQLHMYADEVGQGINLALEGVMDSILDTALTNIFKPVEE